MTEQDAIEEITRHINSGKLFFLGCPCPQKIPHRIPGFWWFDPAETTMLRIVHPAVFVREMTLDEVKANWFEHRPFHNLHPHYYEVFLD